MTFSFYIKLYFLTVPAFFAIDMLWLGIVARDFYQKNLAFVFRSGVNWIAAVVFYLVYIIGILLSAVRPALEKGIWTRAILWGGLFGFFTYATYDLTNLATVKDWPLKVVMVDIIWGIVLCSVVSLFSFHMGRWLS